jgi:hypothetical protein
MEVVLARAALYLPLGNGHFMAQSEATLDVSGFLLTAKYRYYAEGG